MKNVKVALLNGELYIDPINTLAFSQERAEQLNEKVSAIDSRFYCFAYYNPKYYDYDTYAPIFQHAYNNMYALLYDCGKLCGALADKRNRQDFFISEDLRVELENNMMLIHDLRTYFDHNTSPDLHAKNRDISKRVRKFVGNPQTDADWGLLLSKLLEACLQVENILTKYFDTILTTIPLDRRELVLDCILKKGMLPVLSHKDILWNVIEGAYRQACIRDRTPVSNQVRKWELGRWIMTHISVCKHICSFGQADTVLSMLLEQPEDRISQMFSKAQKPHEYYDYYIDYLTNERISNYLHEPDAEYNQVDSLLPGDYFDTVLKPLRSTPVLST